MDQQTSHSNKLRILSIGSNAASAFFSWRLQASQAADLTVVWRSHFESVQQYGISFRSEVYGSDRYRPNRVVRSVEEAAADNTGYDYVFVCVKALPDVYDLGEVIQPVVTSSHTCIIVNTTSSIGIEAALMKSYPRNLILSLCSGIEISQTGPADFEHTSSKAVYIGAVRENPALPAEAQLDMIESLTLTLEAGAVESSSTNNIERYQWEKLIGMIAFQPISVILQEPCHATLMEDASIKELINNLFDECLSVAEARRCSFAYDFKLRTISNQTSTKDSKSTMYQDFLARRPLEIEVYLATPIRLAQEREVAVPYLKSVYALLQNVNKTNQTISSSPVAHQSGRLNGLPPSQHTMVPAKAYRGPIEGRTMSMVQGVASYDGGYNRGVQQPRRNPQQISRNSSLDGLEEFASVAMYNDLVPSNEYAQPSQRSPVSSHNGQAAQYGSFRGVRPQPHRASTTQGYYPNQRPSPQTQQPRHGAFQVLGNKMNKMRMSTGGRNRNRDFDDDDDEEEYIDAPIMRGPSMNPDQVDMLAMTRRGRNSTSAHRLEPDRSATFAASRPKYPSSRVSSQNVIQNIPNVHDSITANALFGMGDNRYGTVDSRSLAKQANNDRLNSMRSERLPSMSNGHYASNGYPSRVPNPPATHVRHELAVSSAPYRGSPQYNSSVASFRTPAPYQAPLARPQQLMPQNVTYVPKASGHNMGDPGITRSVTGSASASIGSLGNGSGSHSSSSSRDELPPVPLPK